MAISIEDREVWSEDRNDKWTERAEWTEVLALDPAIEKFSFIRASQLKDDNLEIILMCLGFLRIVQNANNFTF